MASFTAAAEGGTGSVASGVSLPAPPAAGTMSLEEALAQRRSVREFAPGALTLAEVSRLAWAAQGAIKPEGRTAPSAGATYPLEVYLAVGEVKGLAAGVYRYRPGPHRLSRGRWRCSPASGRRRHEPAMGEPGGAGGGHRRRVRAHHRPLRQARRALCAHGSRPRRAEPAVAGGSPGAGCDASGRFQRRRSLPPVAPAGRRDAFVPDPHRSQAPLISATLPAGMVTCKYARV